MAPPTLELVALADKAIKLKAHFADLPVDDVIVAAYLLSADNGIGIKKTPILDILETDDKPENLLLTKLASRSPVEIIVDKLTNGQDYGYLLEILHRKRSPPNSAISIARSVGTLTARPASTPSAPLVRMIKAVNDTDFEISVANPMFNNRIGDNGSKIVKFVAYLSTGVKDVDEKRPILNDVIVKDIDAETKMYKEDENGVVDEILTFLITGIVGGERYEASFSFLNAVGNGEQTVAQELVGGTSKFGVATAIESTGSDGQGFISFKRSVNHPISNLVAVVLENVVADPTTQIPLAALYYKFNGSSFDLVSKDEITGNGFPFKKDGNFVYQIVVNNIPNNTPLSFKLRLINIFGEGDDLAADKLVKIVAKARPSPIRNPILREYQPLDNLANKTWWDEFRAQSAKLDSRFVGLRSGAVSFVEPLTNWTGTGGKFRVIKSVFESKTSAENTAVSLFLSDKLPADADKGLPEILDRNTDEKALSDLQIRSIIKAVTDATTPAQWESRSADQKLNLANKFPKMVTALEMYYKIMKVSKELEELANGVPGFVEIADNSDDDKNVFDTKDVIKLFFIAGSTPKISLIARLVDPDTQTVLQSDEVLISRPISARPGSMIQQGIFERGNRDVKFDLLEPRLFQGLSFDQGQITAGLLRKVDGKDVVISTQNRIFNFEKSAVGLVLRKKYSLANDFGMIFNNGDKYDITFSPAGAILDTLTDTSTDSSALAKIVGSGIAPVGKCANADASVLPRSDGSVVAILKELNGDKLQGAAFTKFVVYLVASTLASNTKLKGFTQKEIDGYFKTAPTGSTDKNYRVLELARNKNNDSTDENNKAFGIIQSDNTKDYSLRDTEFSKGTKFTFITKVITGEADSSSDYFVGDEQQTFGAPSDVTNVVAVPSGIDLSIKGRWSATLDDGRGGKLGENIVSYGLKLYAGNNTTTTPIYTTTVNGDVDNFTFDNTNTNNKLVIGGNYVFSVQVFTKDFDGEAKQLKSTAVMSNVVILSVTPTISSAFVVKNLLSVAWNSNGTSAFKLFYAFAILGPDGEITPDEFMATVSVSPSATSTTVRYTPAKEGYTLAENGIVVLIADQGNVAFTPTPLNAPAPLAN
jgi:hypothetical protein